MEKDLSEKEEFFIQHTYRWIRCVAILSMLGAVGYVICSDIGLLNGQYYVPCLFYGFIMTYIGAIWWIYIDYKYGTKDYVNLVDLKVRIQAAVFLPIFFLLLHFLSSKS